MTVSPETFREVLGSFATGVTVVTTRLGDRIHGATVSSFTSVSLAPPLVLICVDHTSESHNLIARSKVFAVNILREGQSDLSASLSNKATAGLAAKHSLNEVGHASGVTGSPILDERLAYADCRVINSVEAGDHTIYIGRVEDAGTNTIGIPLVYFRGRYAGLTSNE